MSWEAPHSDNSHCHHVSQALQLALQLTKTHFPKPTTTQSALIESRFASLVCEMECTNWKLCA